MGQRQSGESAAATQPTANTVVPPAARGLATAAEQERERLQQQEQARLRRLDEEKKCIARDEIARLKRFLEQSVKPIADRVKADTEAHRSLTTFLKRDNVLLGFLVSVVGISLVTASRVLPFMKYIVAGSLVLSFAIHKVNPTASHRWSFVVLVIAGGIVVLLCVATAETIFTIIILRCFAALFSFREDGPKASDLAPPTSSVASASAGRGTSSASAAGPSVATRLGAALNANRLTDDKYSNIAEMLSGGVSIPSDMDEGSPICVICMSNQPDVLFGPCGHVRCCVECVRSLSQQRNAGVGSKCPDCRSVIEQVFYPARLAGVPARKPSASTAAATPAAAASSSSPKDPSSSHSATPSPCVKAFADVSKTDNNDWVAL